jgi:membrane-associated protein
LLTAGGIALLAVVAFIVIAFLEGDIPDLDLSLPANILQGKGWIGATALLYAEESGVPMPVPGDFFVMYVGRATGGKLLPLLGAWLLLITAVVLGATNLYLLSRRFGRRWAEGRLGRLLHLTPERLLRAEQAFHRWGVLAIVFGRHIPGFRVPITVVAGTLRTPYPVFAASVAVSTAVWAGVFLIVGVTVGDKVSAFLAAHRGTYWVVGAVVAVVVGFAIFRIAREIRTPAPASPERPGPEAP